MILLIILILLCAFLLYKYWRKIKVSTIIILIDVISL